MASTPFEGNESVAVRWGNEKGRLRRAPFVFVGCVSPVQRESVGSYDHVAELLEVASLTKYLEVRRVIDAVQCDGDDVVNRELAEGLVERG